MPNLVKKVEVIFIFIRQKYTHKYIMLVLIILAHCIFYHFFSSTQLSIALGYTVDFFQWVNDLLSLLWNLLDSCQVSRLLPDLVALSLTFHLESLI